MVHDQDLVAVQEVRTKVEQCYQAWQTYRNFNQAQVDAVVEAMAAKGQQHARALAELAVAETSYGNVPDKIAKNLLNSDLLPRSLRGMKTVGLLRELPDKKVIEIGVPAGVIAALVPTTNPTSTVFFKTIISLKAGNGVVISPHPRAKKSTCEAARLMLEAAVSAGAPNGIIQWLEAPSLESTQALMKHPRTAIILATGGSGMVRAAYSSGKPAYGVGPGNVPVLIDTNYDTAAAIAKVVIGKSFDYGTVCSSEQTIVAERSLREKVFEALRRERAVLLSEEQKQAVQRVLFVNNTTQISPACVGQSPQKIAQMAGISVPADATILAVEINGVGKEHLFSAEKLSPVLAVMFTDSFAGAVDACEAILRFGGVGHTSVIFSNDDARVREFGLRMPSFRVLVNTPAPQGSVGITTNLQPSMTLGCGAVGGNVTSDNVGPLHLINVKRIAWAVRTPDEAMPSLAAATAAATPAAPAAVAAGGVDRQTISAAVEKYLAQRGVQPAAPAASAAMPAAPSCGCANKPAAPAQPALRSVVESVVDQFLTARPAPAAPANCPLQKPAAGAAPAAAAIPAPPVTIADFVCESDVRAAIAQKKKIYIGTKTIVTPAALELAGRDEILVRAERP